jgi:hypothetical protein
MIRRLLAHVPEFLVILFIVGLVGLGIVAVLNRKTVTIPVEYCTETPTGRTREQMVTTNNCYSYDKNGVCTMNVPTTSYYIEKEVNVACNYSEWR